MTMEYAMGSISNQLFVSRYQLYLPDRKLFEDELWRIMKKQELEKEEREDERYEYCDTYNRIKSQTSD